MEKIRLRKLLSILITTASITSAKIYEFINPQDIGDYTLETDHVTPVFSYQLIEADDPYNSD